MYNSILNFIHNFKLKATYTRQSHFAHALLFLLINRIVAN